MDNSDEPENLPPPAIPSFRKSSFCSTLIIIHLVVSFTIRFNPLLALLGIFTSLGLVAVCIIVLTGPVYFDKPRKDGTYKTWGWGNKVAAVILLVIFVGGYAFLAAAALKDVKFG